MSRKKGYLLLPILAVFAFSFGSVSFAQAVDREAIKAELKEELKAELLEEIRAEMLNEAQASVQKATEEVKINFKEEIRSEVMEETSAGLKEQVMGWMEESPLMSGMFKGITATGFIDVSYMYNLRNHGEGANGGLKENANAFVNFLGENDDNTFALENFAMFLDKATTDEHPVGWQMHTYWGEKAKRITFLGDRAGVTDSAAGAGGTDDTARNDIFTIATANITWDAPVGGYTVPLTIGKQYTWIGYELVENIGNPNYSHGIVYNNVIPFTHMGLSADVSEFIPSDKWGLTLYYVDGWDSFIDNNEAKTWGTYLTWAPNDDFFISLATIHGGEGWGQHENGDNTMMYDIVATYSLPQVEKLSLGFNWDHGYSENSGINGESGAHWFAYVQYLMYDFTDRQQGAFRYEYFDDSDGVKGFRDSMWSLTYTHNMTIHENVLIRPEIRYNKYNGADQLSPGDKGNTADSETIIGVGVEYVF